MLCKEATDEVPVESVTSTQVEEKADEEVPMELGMFVKLFYWKFCGSTVSICQD